MIHLEEYLKQIESPDYSFGNLAKERQDTLTKPQGSLGRLEQLSIDIASIKRTAIPKPGRKVIFTLAGDHGITEEGISPFPKEVTVQMVYNFVRGGAGINVLSKHAGAEVIVGDLGVASDFDIDAPNFRNKKVGYGTKNFAKGPAMSMDEAKQSVINGIELFEEENAKTKIEYTAIGEMGIGNTSPATAILCTLTDEPADTFTGRGAGLNDEGVTRKINVINNGIKLNNPDKTNGFDILSKVGGFEIGGMAGIIIAAAKNKIPVLIDGVIATSAALIAYTIEPKCAEYMIASHLSEEKMHRKMLDILGKKPLLDLSLRLGEGTGAAIAMTLVDASLKILNEMATFAEAGVSEKE